MHWPSWTPPSRRGHRGRALIRSLIAAAWRRIIQRAVRPPSWWRWRRPSGQPPENGGRNFTARRSTPPASRWRTSKTASMAGGLPRLRQHLSGTSSPRTALRQADRGGIAWAAATKRSGLVKTVGSARHYSDVRTWRIDVPQDRSRCWRSTAPTTKIQPYLSARQAHRRADRGVGRVRNIRGRRPQSARPLSGPVCNALINGFLDAGWGLARAPRPARRRGTRREEGDLSPRRSAWPRPAANIACPRVAQAPSRLQSTGCLEDPVDEALEEKRRARPSAVRPGSPAKPAISSLGRASTISTPSRRSPHGRG